MGRSQNSPQLVVAREREGKALDLRKAGATYRAIGDELGITESAAFKAVQRAVRRLTESADLSAAEYRRLECERLDAMLKGLWPAAISGSVTAVAQAIDIGERRAKLLGLDAPTKQQMELTVEDLRKASDDELRAIVEAPSGR